MSQEAAPERAVPEQPAPQVSPAPPGRQSALTEQPAPPVQSVQSAFSAPSAASAPSASASSVPSVPEQQGGAPKGLLQQMEELMAALTADLSQLDADIQSSADRQAGTADHPGDARGGTLA
ncbi:hypothetical protein [Streptomyces showdoensis]|uniref:Uncharacterized protein n=1 Tax=Streptomyces showdoensis TaxID=68268 RepID=A0A2P2GEX7_STREW|nr:hypothetical protein VO63_30890 [Streptomyces showdoensis]